jgi:MFS family permease
MIAALSISTMFAPFRVKSFRFQFPADLLTSWGIEIENLVLGWFILVETGSVLLLSLFWALQYLGTLLAPLFGMAGDRIGHRAILCAMRIVYVLLALIMTTLAASHTLRPLHVFLIATASGLIRPSDQTMRNALIAETIPLHGLMPAWASPGPPKIRRASPVRWWEPGCSPYTAWGPSTSSLACSMPADFF